MDIMSHLQVSSTVKRVVVTVYINTKKCRVSWFKSIRFNWLTNKKKVEESKYNTPPVGVTQYNWLSK